MRRSWSQYRDEPLRGHRLQSCATRSSAWASPFSENTSVVSVPFAETPLTVTSAPRLSASTICASSAAFLIQSPSPWVYMAYLALPISSEPSEPGLSWYPIDTDTSLATFSDGRVERNT